jgi:Protein of unknown function (DUF2384)
MGDIIEIKKISRERHILVIVLIRYVDKVFFKDRSRAIYWMDQNNSQLNGQSPRQLILNGNVDKVWSYIESREFDLGKL